MLGQPFGAGTLTVGENADFAAIPLPQAPVAPAALLEEVIGEGLEVAATYIGGVNVQ